MEQRYCLITYWGGGRGRRENERVRGEAREEGEVERERKK